MKATAKDYASLTLDERGLCDLELLAVGGFSPLKGFLGKADYERVVAEMRLADGTLWPLPVTLPVTPGDGVAEGKPLALRDVYGNLLAFLHVEEIYAYDKEAEARDAYGSTDAKHPSVAHLNRQPGHYAAGRLEVIRTPPHYDFVELRRTPAELREHFAVAGLDQGRRLPDPQPAAPGPRGADQAGRRADRRRPADPPGRRRDQAGRRRPLHPRPLLPGPGRQLLRARLGRPQPAARWRCGWPGPREVLLHAIIRRNYGCTHFIVGRDHAGPGNDSTGKPFYAPYAAQESMAQAQGRDRHGDGRLQADGLPARRGPLQPGRRGPRRASRRPTSRAPRSATTTWPRGCSSPSGSAGRPWPRSSTRPARPSSARG